LLGKPFTAIDLTLQVREVLDGPVPPAPAASGMARPA